MKINKKYLGLFFIIAGILALVFRLVENYSNNQFIITDIFQPLILVGMGATIYSYGKGKTKA